MKSLNLQLTSYNFLLSPVDFKLLIFMLLTFEKFFSVYASINFIGKYYLFEHLLEVCIKDVKII